jgi:hypothetical protein
MLKQKHSRKSVMATFAAGTALMAVVAGLALTQAPPRLVRIGAPGTKAIGPDGASVVAHTASDYTICQAGEVLPRGIAAIRLSIWAFYGAPLHVMAYRGTQIVAEGSRGANWTGDSVTVPVRAPDHTIGDVRLCVAIGPNSEALQLLGASTPAPQAAASLASDVSAADASARDEHTLGGRLTVEYLAPGNGSWWSRVLSVARHMGLGRAYSGTWIALLIAALMATVAALAVRLTLRELR